jgi:trk system potassium uptake protein
MNIVILGAGTIGSYLASCLSQENHTVIVIDHDLKALERMSQLADIGTRLGSAADGHLLKEVKEEISADFFIAMSSDDETNFVACAIAKSLGYPKTVARIRQNIFLNQTHVDFSHLFGVDYILGTERILASDIFKCILHPGILAMESFAHGGVEMRTVVIPEHFSNIDKPLAQLELQDDLLIALIRRKIEGEKQHIIFPKGKDHLMAGDEATFIGKTTAVHQFLGIPQKTIRSAVLVGGSGVAMHLTHLLEEQKIKVKIIEQDEQKCLELARLFPSAIILNHDGTDLHFLKEEDISSSDFFVACTTSQEINILASLLAKQAGCEEVIALVSDESIVPLLQRLNVSYVLSERVSIAHKIHVILHENTLVSLASLYDNRAKIMEVKISEESKVVGMPISQLTGSLPKNLLIAMVKNRKDIIIPKGHYVFSSGDTAIVICAPETVKEVERMF